MDGQEAIVVHENARGMLIALVAIFRSQLQPKVALRTFVEDAATTAPVNSPSK
jgi:hypothetical protein